MLNVLEGLQSAVPALLLWGSADAAQGWDKGALFAGCMGLMQAPSHRWHFYHPALPGAWRGGACCEMKAVLNREMQLQVAWCALPVGTEECEALRVSMGGSQQSMLP